MQRRNLSHLAREYEDKALKDLANDYATLEDLAEGRPLLVVNDMIMVARRFRKRPVEIEAVQWTGDNTSDVIDWILTSDAGVARWHEAQPAYSDDEGTGCDATPEQIAIDTLEGTMFASVGDWIIRGIRDEFYPCKPDIFEATYEPVEG